MKEAPLHPHEKLRLQALMELDVLDSEEDVDFDNITKLASSICGTEISLISLVDSKRQWFKSKFGLSATETDRNIAFCSHAILQENVFEIPNATLDERFNDNPLVTGDPNIRFYAGAPLVTSSGMPIGTLCVIDSETRKLTQEQLFALRVLSKQVINELELRFKNKVLQRLQNENKKIIEDLSKQKEQFISVSEHGRIGAL